MSKRPLRVIVISLLGLFIGIFNLFIFTISKQGFFLLVSIVGFILNIGIFKLWNWTRITARVFAWFFIVLYLLLVTYTITGWQYHYGFAGIALFFHLPLFCWCIWALDYLNRPQTKELFKKKL